MTRYDELAKEYDQILESRPDKLVRPTDPENDDNAVRTWVLAGSKEWQEARRRCLELEEAKAREIEAFFEKCESDRFEKLEGDPQRIKENAADQVNLLIQNHYDLARKAIKRKDWIQGIRIEGRSYKVDRDYIIDQAKSLLSKHYAFFSDDPKQIDEIITRIVSANKHVSSEGEYFEGQRAKGTYSTLRQLEKRTGKIEFPLSMVIPTLTHYDRSLTVTDKGAAYIQLLKSTENIVFENGRIFVKSENDYLRELSEAELKNLRTMEKIEEIDLPKLRIFFGITLKNFEATGRIPEAISISAKALLSAMGYRDSRNSKQLAEDLMEVIKSFHDLTGVIKGTSGSNNYYQVLVFHSKEDEIITFSSPYMNHLIRRISAASIKRDGNLEPLKNPDGSPKRVAAYSYMIKNTIAIEKDKAAVENVVIIVSGIERAGNNPYHISFKKLIEENALLAEGLKKAGPSHGTQYLKRHFLKTWQLLRDQTYLTERYENIELPDPNEIKNIPTLKSIEAGDSITIRHGKKRK